MTSLGNNEGSPNYDNQTGLSDDPYHIRLRGLLAELHDKEYPTDIDSLAQTTASIESHNNYGGEDNEHIALRDELLSTPSGFMAYHRARLKVQEIRTILIAEGLVPPANY